MGWFGNARKTVAAFRDMVQDANAAAAAAEASAPITIRNPTPQDEVDRLLAAGGVARGVVVRATHAPLADGERVERMKVTVRVRPRLAHGELGDMATVSIRTSWRVTALLDPGLEIPIELDRATGVVTGIPRDALETELRPRSDEAAERWPGWGFDPPI